MTRQIPLLSIFLIAVLLMSCTKEVTFEGTDRTLTYTCNSFTSKVESDKDLSLLARKTREAVQKMHKIGKGKEARRIGRGIKTALGERDRKRFEELAVEAKCAVTETRWSWRRMRFDTREANPPTPSR